MSNPSNQSGRHGIFVLLFPQGIGIVFTHGIPVTDIFPEPHYLIAFICDRAVVICNGRIYTLLIFPMLNLGII
jgi:hypothetical protein